MTNSKSILESLQQRRQQNTAVTPAVEGEPINKIQKRRVAVTEQPVQEVVEEPEVKEEKVVQEPVQPTQTEEEVEEMTEVKEEVVLESSNVTEVDQSELPVVNASSIKSGGIPKAPVRKSSKPKQEKTYGINEGGTTTKESFEYLLRDQLASDDRTSGMFKSEVTRADANRILGVVYDLLVDVSNKSNIRIGPEMNFKLSTVKARPYHNNFTKVDSYNTEQLQSRMTRTVEAGTRLYGMIPETDKSRFYEAETVMDGTKRAFKTDEDGNIVFTGTVIELNSKK